MKTKITIIILSLAIITPMVTMAQSGSWRGSSSVLSKAAQLDDEPVDNIPIPVLFGIELSDIYPDFGASRGGGTRSHEGQDLLTITGVPIVSPTEAVVRNTGYGASAGNYVYTINPGGEVFAYMHLDEINPDLDAGDVLEVGDYIGTLGYSGNAIASAPHLHFEIHDKEGEATDPYPRITEEFDLEDKMEFLEQILDDLELLKKEKL